MPDIADVAWSERDDRNAEAVPNGWPTGAFPAYTDLVGQMMMGATKRFWNKINPIYQTSGTGDTYVVQTEVGVDQINLYELICVRIDRTNTTSTPTLQFGSANPRTIVKAGASGYVPLAAGDMYAGNSHTFWYNGAFYVLTDPALIVGTTVQPWSANLDSWSLVNPSSYSTSAQIAAAYQPLSANLTSWSAVAPSSYLTTAAAAADYQPLDADLTAIAALSTTATGRALLTIATAAAGFDSLSPTTTRGDLIFRNATTNARLAASTLGYHLQTNGAGTDPTYTGFLQPGTGGVTRTWQAKAQEVFSVKDFGAAGDGVTTDTTAIQAALDAANAAGGGTVFFPTGTYKTGALTLYANVCVRGAGQFSTTFIPAGNSQIFFSLILGAIGAANVELLDFGIDAKLATGIQGLKFVLCMNVYIHNLTFSGCPITFEFDRGRNYNVSDCLNKGTAGQGAGGAKIWSSSDSDYIIDAKVERYYTNNIGNGVQNTMFYVRRGVGTRIVDCASNDLATGGSAQVGILFENDCQGCKAARFVVAKPSIGILVQTGTGVAVVPSFLQIIDCDIDQPSTNCVSLVSGNYIGISGGNFTSSGVVTNIVGIQIQGSVAHAIVKGAIVNGFNVNPGAGIGVSGNSDITITENLIVNCFFGVIFASSTGIRVFNNSLSSITGAKAGGTIGAAGNYIENNFGWNPITVTPPAVPATTVAYTNILGVACSVYVIGGTVTVIAINGTTTGLTSGHVGIVKPGETIAITYSVAPTWNWIGH